MSNDNKCRGCKQEFTSKLRYSIFDFKTGQSVHVCEKCGDLARRHVYMKLDQIIEHHEIEARTAARRNCDV